MSSKEKANYSAMNSQWTGLAHVYKACVLIRTLTRNNDGIHKGREKEFNKGSIDRGKFVIKRNQQEMVKPLGLVAEAFVVTTSSEGPSRSCYH